MTVSDMDRAVNFYSTVLLFEKVSDVEVAGDEFERLQGVFGAPAREALHFRPGRGPPRWQRPAARVFLGMAHPGIVVGDPGPSLRFYRDALGMAVAGGSETHGPEQERLNTVCGPRLRITTLRAA